MCGFSSAYFIYTHQFLLSAALFIFAYIFDCLDGYVARTYNMVTKFGDYYDHVTDVLKLVVFLIALIVVNFKLFLLFMPFFGYFVFLNYLQLFYQDQLYDVPDELHSFNLLKTDSLKSL